jgi:hypothetical protein
VSGEGYWGQFPWLSAGSCSSVFRRTVLGLNDELLLWYLYATNRAIIQVQTSTPILLAEPSGVDYPRPTCHATIPCRIIHAPIEARSAGEKTIDT